MVMDRETQKAVEKKFVVYIIFIVVYLWKILTAAAMQEDRVSNAKGPQVNGGPSVFLLLTFSNFVRVSYVHGALVALW